MRSAPRSAAVLALVLAAVCTALVALGTRWQHLGTPGQPQAGVAALQGWARMDAGWYAHIARQGYSYTPGVQSPVAFFPAYPLVLRGLSSVGVETFLAGVLVTLACGVGAAALFAAWARRVAGEQAARHATLLLLLYPFAFFLYGAVYSDALFLLCALGAFFALERGKVGTAAVLGALATATRPMAPAVVLGLLARRVEWRRARGERLGPMDLLPLVAAAGFGLYALFLWHRFGEPFAFVEVQRAPGWDQAPGWRTWLKLRWLEALLAGPDPASLARLLGHAAVTLLALLLLAPTWRRLGWGYGLYTAAVVGLPALSSKDFMGMGRYLLAAFPLFLTAALLLGEHPRVRRAWLVASAACLAGLTVAFGAGAYVS